MYQKVSVGVPPVLKRKVTDTLHLKREESSKGIVIVKNEVEDLYKNTEKQTLV